MADLNDPFDLLDLWLGAAVDALALTDSGAPGRQFVSPGPPTFDCCPFVSTHGFILAEGPTLAPGGGLATTRRVNTAAVLLYTVVVTAIRCVPMIGDDASTLPTAAELSTSAREVNQDLWALWNRLSADLRSGYLSERCPGAYRDGAQALTPAGGCGGWAVTFRVPLPGIDLTPST